MVAMAKEPLRQDIQDAVDRMGRVKAGSGKYLKQLPEQLADGESVEELAMATQDRRLGLLAATDRRLLFLFKMGFSSSSEDLPYSRVSSVSSGSGMTLGEVTVHVQGRDVEFRQMDKQAAQRVVTAVRSRL